MESESDSRPLPDDLSQAFARCLGGPNGQQVIQALRRLYLDRRLPPSARDAELWHLEGQRSVVAYILNMTERGRIMRPF